ncbi:extracellular solute-binding protein [Marinobacterium arenosum]|uniref:extracellular solute-binding protein n=1 Tax=Marinobacterium arenosum TaxID=2862496 RepID=UPI001C97DDEC|nr:extracellular solute-binding protein [Marinobacterium arenosum]MBY4678176.1 extracellular solute-binding protein [Marinobacterium arenosum]
MTKLLNNRLGQWAIGTALASAMAVSQAQAEEVVKVYNWSDYIAPEVIEQFEQETGIDVIYDVFDSNEVLEAKLLSGNSGFDVVVPTSFFLGRQVKAGVFAELDKGKLGNYSNLDPMLLAELNNVDPGNAHAVPYLWGTTGIGYNVDKVKAALGQDAPVDSWELVFKEENIAKLASCGVAMLDTPSEIMPAALRYLKKNPNSSQKADYKNDVAQLLKSIRPHITYFHSSQYINDLANGDICVAVGFSGDVIQAAARAQEAANGVHVAYSIPKEGAAMWFDMLAIPADATNKDNAHKFIDFVLRPEVIAKITNFVAYANPNEASLGLVDKAIRDDVGIFPSNETKAKLFTYEVLPQKITRVQTRVWTDVKSGR